MRETNWQGVQSRQCFSGEGMAAPRVRKFNQCFEQAKLNWISGHDQYSIPSLWCFSGLDEELNETMRWWPPEPLFGSDSCYPSLGTYQNTAIFSMYVGILTNYPLCCHKTDLNAIDVRVKYLDLVK